VSDFRDLLKHDVSEQRIGLVLWSVTTASFFSLDLGFFCFTGGSGQGRRNVGRAGRQKKVGGNGNL